MQKALIVDDRSDNLYLLQSLLASNGFEVVTATNGKEAIDYADQYPPDIVITDILMPVMDGFSLCRLWKQNERLKSIPFVFYTATYTDPRDEEFALSLGADLFITKPQDPAVFMERVMDVVVKQRAHDFRLEPGELPTDEAYLNTYNKTLIRKLEDKLFELDTANKALLVKDFAIDSSISGVVIADLAGMLTYANPSFTRMLGYENKELIARHPAALVGNPTALLSMFNHLRAKGNWVGEIDAKKKDGTTIILQIAAHTVMNPGNEALCYMASCLDITRQKQIEAELQRTQKLESLSLFAAGIAHDFNNLLTSLFNNIAIAGDYLPPDHPAQEPFRIAMSVFEQARDLTRRLLTFAKGGSTIRRKVDAKELISVSAKLSLGGTGTQCEISMDTDLRMIEANTHELSQVFNNIILNARQAMDDKGLLRITASNVVLPMRTTGALLPGEYVVIRFKDSGPGIPGHILGKIFDPFFTTKKDGSGLGLSISYGIIKNHGGDIRVESKEGEGAVFEIWLPAAPENGLESVGKIPQKKNKESGYILIMDDEEAIRKSTRLILMASGYEVAAAENGTEALALYEKALASQRPFDLVILDLTVRGGMGGEETLDALLKINPHVAAIAASGYADESLSQRLTERGFLKILAKPYWPNELLAIVKAII
jgi:two-component system cell cycle sensor histidine kinase/response regulator CckA